MITILQKIFGTRNHRLVKQMYKVVEKINRLEAGLQPLSDLELKSKTDHFRLRLQSGESLDKLLPEAFAVVREASMRALKQRPFDVQLIGAMALHAGKIAEMRTGEGKTLMSTLAIYLNALPAQGVHVITVNDYLAKRDAIWMTPLFEFLGMTVTVNSPYMNQVEKKAAYAADITYGTNNEFGFDYLRDNMAFEQEGKVQRDLYYAVIDEVDSILIDEARTPLIISGIAEQSSELYLLMNELVPQLTRQLEENGPGDYILDEKSRQVYLSEEGHRTVEKLLITAQLIKDKESNSLYEMDNITLMHHLYAALRAHCLYHRDIDYIVKDEQVVIVDEHTGRLMPGRRWADGLHQATEAKEKLPIKNENQTLATITFQNYFRLYPKLGGMTGTADTEAYEFQEIYGLEVVVIPTNKPIIRTDLGDLVYLTEKAKFIAIVEDIEKRHLAGQPVLVGTASIEASERLSHLLKQKNILHQVLNAKFHEQEAKIIAEAGRPRAVTIATNMAGRGTDIILGGNLQMELFELSPDQIESHTIAWENRHQTVIDASGLHVLGTERNESRRIDNQLRGRAGRQGDPGSSQYYLSLEDSLMRIFAPERMIRIMRRLGMKENEAIQTGIISRAIENAQKKVEGQNFETRKQLLELDNVANDQRKVIYEQRKEIINASDIADRVNAIRQNVINELVDAFIPPQSLEEQWDITSLEQRLAYEFDIPLGAVQTLLNQNPEINETAIKQWLEAEINSTYQAKEAHLGSQLMRQIEKNTLLQSLDNHWREHLAAMDHLRKGIYLRGYAQKNPKQEYKREAFLMFNQLLSDIKKDMIMRLSKLQTQTFSDLALIAQQKRHESTVKDLQFLHPDSTNQSNLSLPAIPLTQDVPQSPLDILPKVGRNHPCPCGSGKKFKYCHGALLL